MQSSFPIVILPRDNGGVLHLYEHHPKVNADNLYIELQCGTPLEENILYTDHILLDKGKHYTYMGEVTFIVRFTKNIFFTSNEVYMSNQLKAKIKADFTPKIIYRLIRDMHKSNECFWTPNIILNKEVNTQHKFLRDSFRNIYNKSLSESLNTNIYHLQEYIVQTKKSVFIPFYLPNRTNTADMELVYIPLMKASTCPSLLTYQELSLGILEYARILLFTDND